ncbi:chemotaxis protein CheB [Pedobacter sp. MR2016-24]|uniref:chemotaxis protein CheB n=1 Tax=Pedobacter sp. MR2016-24 TaxID=2994466 RepID=UPI002245E8D2|nr:chemotaxis protein CheB [Pedobacter sp. MR2016-24]MCX2486177.1 chemotaxis protein CheB [Pedobacter sp. MR2016-24]
MKDRYIVALGASSGGIAALCSFFDNTLPDGVTYIITTHMYPYQKSLLTEILQQHSDIEVCEVENKMQILSNIIYVMPENKVMYISDGKLMLEDRDLAIKVNYAIDIFFQSLASDTLFKKIAIVLSGMGVDGTKGVQAIAEAGGYIIAQKPLSAQESSMPLNVIKKGFVDDILYPRQMPAAIIAHMKQKFHPF